MLNHQEISDLGFWSDIYSTGRSQSPIITGDGLLISIMSSSGRCSQHPKMRSFGSLGVLTTACQQE
jgi:hypothetical protein